MQLLADFMISGDWLIGGLVTLLPIIGGVWIKAKQAGRKEGENSRSVTLKPPVPEVTTREAPKFAASGDLQAHEARTADALKQMAEDIDQLHTRINSAFRKLDTLDGSVDAIREITGKLLDLALGLPQGTTAARTKRQARNE